jgi:hypothetical protein
VAARRACARAGQRSPSWPTAGWRTGCAPVSAADASWTCTRLNLALSLVLEVQARTNVQVCTVGRRVRLAFGLGLPPSVGGLRESWG